MKRSRLTAIILIAALVVGMLGAIGTSVSYSNYIDSHDGTGSINASSAFGPIANAGGPYSLYENSSVELDGTNSTSSGSNLGYSWEIISGNGSLSETTTSTPTYSAPEDVDSNVTVTVELNVSNSDGSDTDTADITVMDADGGCGASELTFCSYDASETADSYDITYKIDDPSGSEFKNVTVTLIEKRTGKDKFIESKSSGKKATEITVSDGGKLKDSEYEIMVELYNQSSSVVECLDAVDTAGDGSDPSLTAC